MEKASPYTISELNQLAKNLLEGHFPSLWVTGELSNLAAPRSGHLYFSLKDAHCQIRCALFRGVATRLTFFPQDGQQVLAKVRVSLFEPRGDFQLIVEQLEEFGLGALHRQFELLKQKFQEAGYFEAIHKKALPVFPQCIGVVTSPTGAAIRDILITLKRRCPRIPVIIYPTQVQGKTASHQIAQAIELANRARACDVLIVARGGGSLEDLWPFNEEVVALAIFHSQIPIISGIGHEVDITLADYVADVRGATPTAAAELVSPNDSDWRATLTHYYQHLCQLIQSQVADITSHYQQLRHRLKHPRELLLNQMQAMDWIEQKLVHLFRQHLHRQEQEVKQSYTALIRHNPTASLIQYQERTRYLSANLVEMIQQVIRLQHNQLQSQVEQLNAVSPLNTLCRGYAILKKASSQKLVTHVQDVSPGEIVIARLQDGQLQCIVHEIL